MPKVKTPESYAYIAWTANDVKTIRPRWSLKRCELELAKISKWLAEALIEHGWRVLHDMLPRK
jgi:hypothetical protein